MKKAYIVLIMLLSVCYSSKSQIPTDSLIAYYPFNGNANDESGYGNHGAVNGAELAEDRFGNINSAYSFDGLNDYIEALSSPSLNFGSDTSFTLCFWMKSDSQIGSGPYGLVTKSVPYNSGPEQGWQALIAFPSWDYHIRWEFGMPPNSASITSNINPLDNLWHFITIVCNRDSSTNYFYYDGILENSIYSTEVSTNISNIHPLRIGAERMLVAEYFYHGFLDDIRIYNKALTDSEILDLYYETPSNNWVLTDSITTNKMLHHYTCNNEYIFVRDNDYDSVYVIDIDQKNFIYSHYIPNPWAVQLVDNRLYVQSGSNSIKSFNVSNVTSWIEIETFSGLDDGFFYTEPNESEYIFWAAHWASKIQIINVTGNNMVLNDYVPIGGNPYQTARNGNYAYVRNAYNQGSRIDMTDPNTCTVVPWGNTQGATCGISESGLIIQGRTNVPELDKNVILYDDSQNQLDILEDSISDVKTLPNNFAVIQDRAIGQYKIFDILTAQFQYVISLELIQNTPGGGWIGPGARFQYNDSHLIYMNNSNFYFYNRDLRNELQADFTASLTSGNAPLQIDFTDLSTGNPTIWKWDFENDGIFDSYIQYPSYTYTEAGTYSVKLVVESDNEIDSLIKYNYITVNPQGTGSDLIAYYPFNGNADDESGNGHHGAVSGATLANDRFGNENSAYNFDGVNDYIFSTIGDSDTLAVSFWYNAPYPDKYYPTFFSYYPTGFFGQYGGTLNPPYTPGDVMCFPANSGLQSLAIPAFDQWHHVYMDIDNVGNTQIVYVDGEYDNTYSGVTTITTGDDFHMGVGDPSGTPLQYFTGNLDDFRIYGRRLSEGEIIELYNESNVEVPEICIVTVDEVSGQNLVIWEKQVTTEIDSFRVYRETTQANVYEHIGSVPYADTSIFLDENSVPVQRAYKYKISAVDINGNETILSNYHKTMHLTYSTGPQGMNLNWDQYEGFEFGTYYIYKSTNPNNLELIDSISSSFTSYTDIYPPWGNVYYVIEIRNPDGCYPTRDEYNVSWSNIVFNPQVSVSENPIEDIRIYPIPTTNNLFIEPGESWDESNMVVRIMNLQGQVMINDQLNSLHNEIILQDFKPGLYILWISDGENQVVRKIIKK